MSRSNLARFLAAPPAEVHADLEQLVLQLLRERARTARLERLKDCHRRGAGRKVVH